MLGSRKSGRLKIGDVAAKLVEHWRGFFNRFRPDEQEFELVNYREDAAAIEQTLAANRKEPPDPATCVAMLDLLESFSERRHQEQNQRLNELMDVCDQLRIRLETSELERSHLQDEFGHCMAIAKAAMERHSLGEPEGLTHAPRLHNLFNQLLEHLEPHASRVDTKVYRRKVSEAAEDNVVDPPSLFDYDRLRRLFRKSR
ncbi:MAG: hypothetical protein H0W83_11340 [Planctomycetes bacterium]|nr:hypothetical protein [Planctomycetota bacterium]